MDVLSDVLGAVRLTGAVYFDIDAGCPWVGESPDGGEIRAAVMPSAQHVIQFHAVLAGSCWAAVADRPDTAVQVNAGDVVVFPHGSPNTMSSARGLRGKPDMAMYYRPTDRQLPFMVIHGSDGDDRTRFVCGYLGCDTRPFNPLLANLPDILCARRPENGEGWITDLFQLALAEGDRRRAGTETILAKVSELMFVEVIRRHLESLPEGSRGWLSGLRDPQVGEALRLIHGRPGEEWTLQRLAKEVGLSRTTFAARFTHFVDVSPMHYLARWRMQLAARRLESPGISIAQAAAEVGYESEAAFNRAFKKLIGQPPGSWRKTRQPAARA